MASSIKVKGARVWARYAKPQREPRSFSDLVAKFKRPEGGLFVKDTPIGRGVARLASWAGFDVTPTGQDDAHGHAPNDEYAKYLKGDDTNIRHMQRAQKAFDLLRNEVPADAEFAQIKLPKGDIVYASSGDDIVGVATIVSTTDKYDTNRVKEFVYRELVDFMARKQLSANVSRSNINYKVYVGGSGGTDRFIAAWWVAKSKPSPPSPKTK